jgi:hypothetical protein
VKRFDYDSDDQLRTHLAGSVEAYNFARRLKTLNSRTPYEHTCKVWTSEPDRFTLEPIHQMPGLNTVANAILKTCGLWQPQVDEWAQFLVAVLADLKATTTSV